MNGCILASTPIAVDYWRVKQQDPYLIHFLSHMHTDHTSGLSSSWRRPLYCSEVTGKILRRKLQVCKSLINILPIGQPTVIPLGRGGRETVTATAIDANHCPGAVMFLFEGYFGKILYTADFKYTPSMFSEPGLNACPLIDKLYLDNTYNDPQCNWPSNETSAGLIENIITTSIGHSDIVIAVHKLGKEELLVRIARKFQRWIVVTPEQYELFQLLELPNVFTTDREASNIRVVYQTEVTWKNVVHWNSNRRKTVIIVPSALFNLGKTKRAFEHPNVYLVPYTSHSSYPELFEFVRRLCPRKVLPIVRDKGSSADVSNFDKLLSCEKPAAQKRPGFLQEKPEDYHVEASTKTKSHKPGIPKEKRLKRKIAQGVVFVEPGDNWSTPDPTCASAASSEQKDKRSSVLLHSGESDEWIGSNREAGYPESLTKKKKCESGTPSPENGDNSGESKENQRTQTASGAFVLAKGSSGGSSQHGGILEVQEEKTSGAIEDERDVHEALIRVGGHFNERHGSKRLELQNNYHGRQADSEEDFGRKNGSQYEDTNGNHCDSRGGSGEVHPEKNVLCESDSVSDSTKPEADDPHHGESRRKSCTLRDERLTDLESWSDSNRVDGKRWEVAIVPVKHRHSFYEAFDVMQALVNKRCMTKT